MRRFLAFVLTLLLANVNVARASLACENETEHRSQPAQQQHAHHAPAGGHDHEAPVPQDDTGTPICCQAVASCSMTMDAWAERGRSLHDAGVLAPVPPSIDAPASRIDSPEPPPPRD